MRSVDVTRSPLIVGTSRDAQLVLTDPSVLVIGKTTLSLEIVWPGELDVFSNRRAKAPSDIRLLERSGTTHPPERDGAERGWIADALDACR